MDELRGQIVDYPADPPLRIVGTVDSSSVPSGKRLFDKLLEYGFTLPTDKKERGDSTTTPTANILLAKENQLDGFLQEIQKETKEWEGENPVEKFGRFLTSMPNTFADVLLTLHSVIENITLARVAFCFLLLLLLLRLL